MERLEGKSSKKSTRSARGSKKKEKVVDVALKSRAKKKTKAKATTAKSKSAAKTTKTAKSAKATKATKTAKAKPAAAVAKKSKKPLIKKKSATAELETKEEVMPSSPTEKQLKAFQRAQKRSRALAKAAQTPKKSKKGKFIATPPRKGKKYKIDLRIHSPVTDAYFSTGGVQSADALVRLARAKGLSLIAVTDYFSVAAVDAVKECSEKTSTKVIPGFDFRCTVSGCDDVHFIALFPEEKTSLCLQKVLDDLEVPHGVAGSAEYSIETPFADVLKVIEKHDGVLIPTRMDQTPHRQSVIGTLIEEHGFHVFDLTHLENTEFFKQRWPDGAFTFVSFSNANSLAQIGSRIAHVKLEKPGFEGLQTLVARR